MNVHFDLFVDALMAKSECQARHIGENNPKTTVTPQVLYTVANVWLLALYVNIFIPLCQN